MLANGQTLCMKGLIIDYCIYPKSSSKNHVLNTALVQFESTSSRSKSKKFCNKNFLFLYEFIGSKCPENNITTERITISYELDAVI